MRDRIVGRWFACHWLAMFFNDFEKWSALLAQTRRMLPQLQQLVAADTARLAVEYDDLFKGVNADVHIPLWASACKGKGDTLLDKTTLQAVRYYRENGYQVVDLDGNPPDFIGQQLRFLSYLYAGALHGQSQAIEDSAEQFISLFTLDTVRVVADGIKRHTASGLFLQVADWMLWFFGGGIVPEHAGMMETLRDADTYTAYEKGLHAPLPLETARIINTAGRNNCGGKCVIRAEEQAGCVLHIDSDCGADHTQVRACVRGRAYRGTFLSAQRLRYPMQRVGSRGEGRFRRISWEEAAEITAREWKRITHAYGPGARYVNYATGVSAVVSPNDLIKRLLNLDGGYLGRYNSYSSACSRYTTPYIYGDIFSGNSIEDVRNTKLLILWGHNPAETIFGSTRNYYLAQARDIGVRMIVIDPRYSDSAIAYADEWIGVRPSTDSALADGMAYVIWTEGLYDKAFMDKYGQCFDEEHMPPGIPAGHSYEAYLKGVSDGIPKTPEWAAQITGVPAQTIVRLARDYAATKPACILPGLGLQRTGNGEQTVRSLAMLACLTGNVGISGGGAAGDGQVKGHAMPFFPTLNDVYPGKIPCFVWTKAIEHPGMMTPDDDGIVGLNKLETGIKFMINLAGNTLVNQHADIHSTTRLLKDTSACEFILCSDVFMTASAKYADILLPATSFLESDNLSTPWDFGDYLLFNNKVVDPLFGCRFEYGFIHDVAEQLGLLEQWEDGHDGLESWLKAIYEEVRVKEPELPAYEVFRETGGHHFAPQKPYIAYEEEIKDLERHPFGTPSGKIEIFSQRIYDLNRREEIPAIPCYVPCPEGPEDPLRRRYPLQLIGWHTKRRCHSIHDNNPLLEEVEPQRVWMHPVDADKRGITEGDLVEVYNDRGRIRIPVYVTKRIVKGVVAIPQGAWFTPGKDGVDTRGSINTLTSLRPTPLARGNAQHTNLVEVSKIR